MELPIPFPSDADVIREEVARFRALKNDERVREICRLWHEGIEEQIRTGRFEEIDRLHTEQHRVGMRNVIELGIKLGMIRKEEIGLEEPYHCSKS